MNATIKLIAMAIAGATFASSAFAGGGKYPADYESTVTALRTDARAEMKTLPPLIQGDSYPIGVPSSNFIRSRAELRAEMKALPPLIQGDSYPILEQPKTQSASSSQWVRVASAQFSSEQVRP